MHCPSTGAAGGGPPSVFSGETSRSFGCQSKRVGWQGGGEERRPNADTTHTQREGSRHQTQPHTRGRAHGDGLQHTGAAGKGRGGGREGQTPTPQGSRHQTQPHTRGRAHGDGLQHTGAAGKGRRGGEEPASLTLTGPCRTCHRHPRRPRWRHRHLSPHRPRPRTQLRTPPRGYGQHPASRERPPSQLRQLHTFKHGRVGVE
jgi:hypothetical protein